MSARTVKKKVSKKKTAKKKAKPRASSVKKSAKKVTKKAAKKKAAKKKVAKKKATKKKATKKAPPRKVAKKKVTRKPAAKKVTKKKSAKKVTKKAVPTKVAKATPPPKPKKKPVVKKVVKKEPVKSAQEIRAERAARRKMLKRFRGILVEKQATLLRVYNNSKVDTRSATSDGTEDYIDYAVSSYDRDFMLSLTENQRHQLMQVEDAIRRVDKGEFGRCLNCGLTIPEKRLEVEPWARHCVRCQELEEQGLLDEHGGGLDVDDDETESDDDSEAEVVYKRDLPAADHDDKDEDGDA